MGQHPAVLVIGAFPCPSCPAAWLWPSPRPHPRRAARVTYALPALLTLVVAALLAHHLSALAIAE